MLVAALGGSALVCDVLDLLAEPGSPVPVTTRGGPPLPGWVGPLDLVIAVSQSGRATGPLALAAEAARRGASLLTVGAAGSPLADVSARARGVHVEVALPTPSSRTALWSLLTPVLLAADAMGLVQCPAGVLERVADVLDEVAEECRPSSEAFVNPAKILALGLGETVPIVLGDGPLTGVAATRAASMLARTARVPATYGALPDAASQVVACLDGPFGSGPRPPRHRAATSSPTPSSTPRPPHGSACSRCATPTSTPSRSRSPMPWSSRLASRASRSGSRWRTPASRSSGSRRWWRSPTTRRPTSRSAWGSTRRCHGTSPSCATEPPRRPAGRGPAAPPRGG